MKILKRIIPIIVSLIFIISSAIVVLSRSAVRALADTALSEVETDLGKMTIDGKAFNEADYPVDPEGLPQLLLLNEIGYCKENTDFYGLTLYVYNPAQLEIRTSDLNTVQIQFETNKEPEVYNLTMTSISKDKRFARFAVSMKAADISEILATFADKTERVYDVNSLDLHVEGFNATAFVIERKFIYKGYYSDDLSCSLNYTVAGGTETLPVEAYPVSWSPDGTNGEDRFHRDVLHSVYFCVPNEVEDRYDYLQCIKAQYLGATTKPFIVTSHERAYKALLNLIDANSRLGNPDEFVFDWDKMFGVFEGYERPGPFLGLRAKFSYLYGWDGSTFRWDDKMTPDYWGVISGEPSLDGFVFPYYTNGESSDDVVLTQDVVLDILHKEAENPSFNDEIKVAGKYPSYMFESFDDEKTTIYVNNDEFGKSLKLHSEQAVRDSGIFITRGYHGEKPRDYDNIKAIYEVKPSDMYLSDDKLSNSLYICKEDLPKFKQFYDENKDSSTIYLMRFAVSSSLSAPCVYGERCYNQGGTVYGYLNITKDNYLSTSDCFFDFDIIYLDYNLKGKSYIIPVTMSPIDIVTPIRPPIKYDEFWKAGFIIIAALAVVAVVYGISKKAVKK